MSGTAERVTDALSAVSGAPGTQRTLSRAGGVVWGYSGASQTKRALTLGIISLLPSAFADSDYSIISDTGR